MSARRLGQGLTLVVLVASGAYMLIYLYRWEWNRALVSGMFFVAAEVALLASSVTRRLRALEERLDKLPAATTHGLGSVPGTTDGVGPSPLERIREAAPERTAPFAWLDPSDGRMGVFVPVLMGAGVVLSALAYLVERLAGATTGATLEPRLARRLVGLSLPTGGLVPLAAAAAAPAPSAQGRAWARHGRETASRLLAVAVVGLLLITGIDLLADATQNRPDPIATGLTTHIELEVAHRKGARPVERTAEALWVTCRGMLPRAIEATSIIDIGGGQVRMVLEPAIGEHGRRRFQGCLQDATIDKVQGTVLSVETVRDT